MKLEISIHPHGTLRIGSGEPSALIHLPAPLLRAEYQGSFVPIIPGSSIKGVLRKAALKFFDEICDRMGLEKIVPLNSVQPGELKEHWEKTGEKDIVMSLFGAPNKIAKIRVSDAFPLKPEEAGKNIIPVARTSIDREIGTVVARRLFTVEKIPPGSEFRCTLSALEELTKPELLLLFGALRHLPYVGLGLGSSSFSIKVGVEEPPRGGFPPEASEILSELERGVSV